MSDLVTWNSNVRCAVCSDDLGNGPLDTCPACETAIHVDCREFIGGCARYACDQAATPRRRAIELLGIYHRIRASRFIGATVIFGALTLVTLPRPSGLFSAWGPFLVFSILASVSGVLGLKRRAMCRQLERHAATSETMTIAARCFDLTLPAEEPERTLRLHRSTRVSRLDLLLLDAFCLLPASYFLSFGWVAIESVVIVLAVWLNLRMCARDHIRTLKGRWLAHMWRDDLAALVKETKPRKTPT